MLFESEFSLSSLDETQGFAINGIDIGDRAGTSVSSIGDFNGDGLDDVIIGAPKADPNGDNSGESYVVFGSADGFDSDLDLASLDGRDGFVLEGAIAGDEFGAAVSGLGDANGDGLNDVVIGAPGSNSNNSQAGKAYVVFGTAENLTGLDVSALDGTNGFEISANEGNQGLRGGVSIARDINGDGFDEVIVGNYVIFGTATGFGGSVDVSSLDGNNGFSTTTAFGDSGASVSSAGDVNNDGLNDIVLSGSLSRSTLIFGSTEGFGSNLDLVFGSDDIASTSIPVAASVSNAGDVNGDGIDDIIGGSPEVSETATDSAYVIFGDNTLCAESDNSIGNNSIDGFRITPATSSYSTFGYSVSGAGDINGDGIDDVVIGDPVASSIFNASVSLTYVLFGRAGENTFDQSLDSSEFDGNRGFRVLGAKGGDLAGTSVSDAGDVNGDGIDDLIIGAPGGAFRAEPSTGASYIIFGRSATTESNPNITESLNPVEAGTSDNDGITGTEQADSIQALAGNDVIDGGEGADLLDGGEGIDTALYQFDPAGVVVDLSTGSATDGFGDIDTLSSIENVIGSDFDDTLIGDDSANSLTGRAGDDRLEGGLGDDTLLGGEGADSLAGGEGADRFLYLSVGEGGDAIADFESGIDKLLLIGAAFGGLPKGAVPTELFFSEAEAASADQRLGYNATTGEVLFDADGLAGEPAQVLATLTGAPGFISADIVVL